MKSDQDRILIEKFLKKLPVFRSISENYLHHIVTDFNVLRLKKGEPVFYQSDDCTDLYIVLEGAVRTTLMNEEGQELILTTFREGEFFGEMSLLDGRPRSATIITEEDSTLGVLQREKFLRAVKNEPMIAIDLLAALVERLRKADEMIESLAFLDVSQRLIKLLLQIARDEGERGEDGYYRFKKITHKELAARTGASREAISKVLKALALKEIIKEREGWFLVSPDADEVC